MDVRSHKIVVKKVHIYQYFGAHSSGAPGGGGSNARGVFGGGSAPAPTSPPGRPATHDQESSDDEPVVVESTVASKGRVTYTEQDKKLALRILTRSQFNPKRPGGPRDYARCERYMRSSRDTAETFGQLAVGSLRRWDAEAKTRALSGGGVSKRRGRPLGVPPEVFGLVEKRLHELARPQGTSGYRSSMTSGLLRAEILAVVEQARRDGHLVPADLRCSPSTVGRWLKRLKLTLRRPTSSAQLPDDWQERGRDAALRLAFYIGAYGVPRRRVVNADQTSVLLVPSSQEGKALAPRGERHVTIPGTGDKRNCTAFLGINAEGEPIGAQIISVASGGLPSPPVVAAFEAAAGDITRTLKGWTSFQSLKRYVVRVVVPYFKSVGGGPIERTGVDDDSAGGGGDSNVCVLVLDVWKDHISNKFREWRQRHYPWIKVLFVPANCTSVLQPCDIALMKPFKAAMRDQFSQAMVDHVSTAAAAAAAAGGAVDASMDAALREFLKIRPLRERVPSMVLKALEVAKQSGVDPKNPDAGNALKKAWDKTWGKGWLSAEFRREAREHVERLFPTAALEDAPDGERQERPEEPNDYQAYMDQLAKHLDNAAVPAARQPKDVVDVEKDDADDEPVGQGRGRGRGRGGRGSGRGRGRRRGGGRGRGHGRGEREASEHETETETDEEVDMEMNTDIESELLDEAADALNGTGSEGEQKEQDGLARTVDAARTDRRRRRDAARQCHAFLKKYAKGTIKPRLVLAPASDNGCDDSTDDDE